MKANAALAEQLRSLQALQLGFQDTINLLQAVAQTENRPTAKLQLQVAYGISALLFNNRRLCRLLWKLDVQLE